MPEEPVFPEDPIQWMYEEWRKSIEGTPTDRVLDLIEGGARTAEGFIRGVQEAGEGLARELQVWVTDPGRKLEQLPQLPGLMVEGWGAMLRPVATGLASVRSLLEQVMAAIRLDPTLTLTVDPENLVDLHAAASALNRVVEASHRLREAALGLAEGAGLRSGSGVEEAWAGLLMAGVEGPSQALARVFREASRFMIEVLARNGQGGSPVNYWPPIRIPVLPKPSSPLIIIAVEELPGRLGALEKARTELAEAMGGLRLALARLETWEGYARLGFRDGVEQAFAPMQRFVGPVMMGILDEARPLPTMAREMAAQVSRIAPVDVSVLRVNFSYFHEAEEYLRYIYSVSEDLAGQLTGSAGALRAAWAMRDGGTAADELESWGRRARVVVGGTAQRVMPLLLALRDQVKNYWTQTLQALVHRPREMIASLRGGEG